MGAQQILHLVGQRGDVLPRDEEGRGVEQVQEDLVPVAESRAKVLVTGRAARAQLLGAEHPLHQQDVVICGDAKIEIRYNFIVALSLGDSSVAERTSPLGDQGVDVHQLLDQQGRLVESGLILVQADHDDTHQRLVRELPLAASTQGFMPSAS